MSSVEKNDLLTQFMGVTGADPERARFYLESAAWKLEVAMESFYDHDGDDLAPPAASEAPKPPARSSPPPQPTAGSKVPKKTSQSRFATLSSVHSDSASDSDEGQAYYAGGSEHGGGQQIIDPTKKKKKKNADELVQDMFKAAKEHGAEEVAADAAPGGSSARRGPGFGGTAYRLGETDEPSISVPGMSAPHRPRQVDMVLKLWKEGFSVDDGPLRGYQDEANQQFLNAIKKGEVPRELISLAKGGEVNLSMEDHKTEDFVKPKAAHKPFVGEGHRLGSPATVPESMPRGGSSSVAVAASGPAISINDSLPTTNIQIRLPDGSRLVQKFNHTHTVADIRQFIIDQRPQFAASNFSLMTTFPNKEITDETQSLAEAKLLNAVLVQRMK